MKKFLKNLSAVLIALGLTDKFKSKGLSAEEQNSIIEAYNKEFGENSFYSDHKAFEDEQKKEAETAALKETFAKLSGILGTPETSSAVESGDRIVQAVENMRQDLHAMAQRSQGDHPEAVVERTITISGAHTANYAFGVHHPLFDATKRWNRIAINRRIDDDATNEQKSMFHREFTNYCEATRHRVGELAAAGLLLNLKPMAAVTVSGINNDTEIGTRQFTIRQDALIARIMALPSLERVFSKVSNVQSGQVMTNVLFSEISQAYQAGHVYKGSVSIQPEKAIVDKAMAKVQFVDMSELETSYLNYMNTNGSDPVKWNMIEWFLLHIATQIAKEKVVRGMQGRFVKPVANVPGFTNFASTGMIPRLISYVDSLKLNPFKGEDVDNYDSSNIGDTLIAFMSRISAVRTDWGNFVVYVNEAHKPWFIHWYQAKYGSFNNYEGEITSKVPEYGNPLVWVPGMGQLQFIFSSVAGNLQLLENIPGEEYRVQFQRDLETVVAFSYWKEGTVAGFVGPKYDNAADLESADYENQMVFMNWPAVDVNADAATLDAIAAKAGHIFQLPNTNTAHTAITDISNAKTGVVYRIVAPAEAGTYKSTIAKEGKFAGLASAVDFSTDKYVDVYYDAANSQFVEVARG